MTATMERLTERIDVGEITKQAKDVRPGRTALLLTGGLLWAIGWLTGKLFGVLWLALAWSGVAVRTGWREARGKPLKQPSLEVLMAENVRLRAELSRLQV